MLKPSEFSVGPLASANGMTLILPRSGREPVMLVVKIQEQSHVIFLNSSNGMEAFRSFECSENTAWSGILVPGVEIEIDETSTPLQLGRGLPLGGLTRAKDQLAVQIWSQGWADPLVIMDGLPACTENKEASFLKWQVVLGEGVSKRVLHRIDVSTGTT